MIPYMKKILHEFPDKIGRTAATTACNHLFWIQSDDKQHKSPKDQPIAFHHCVAQLLFLAMRARREIHTAVAFLTTCA